MDFVATTLRRVVFRLLPGLIGMLLLAGAVPATALAEEGGAYTLQCFCPLEWDESWDGQGVFDESDSLDTVALTNGGAVLLIHEIPLDEGSLEGMVEGRSDVLDGSRALDDLDETLIDEDTQDWILMGRSWTNAEGDTMLSAQYVQVWEVSFLLSIEFVAPEDDFVDAWDSLDEVLLVGSPVLAEFDAEDIADEIA
ncbi:MAG: hypothetical protein M3490_11510 [Chloroflexota bacterium]|nr:hypothetical protein [Chloroflexota bacterium]